MSCTVIGPIGWAGKTDADGHREYKVEWRVRGEVGDGPQQALIASGLPTPGTSWSLGNDVDLWAFCQVEMSAKPDGAKDGEQGRFFIVEQTYSTKNKRRCADHKVEDPLLEPPKISISTDKKKEEAVYDMFGLPILTSSHEMIRGPQVEFEVTKSKVHIEQNVPTFVQAFNLPNAMLNHVNANYLWGLPPRCVLLEDLSVEIKYYGNCNVYYTRKLTFLTDPKTFDRNLVDEGTKVLRGHWNNTTGEWALDNIAGEEPDPNNPKHFILFPDRAGNPIRGILDGFGKPAGAQIGNLGDYICIRKPTVGATDLADTTYWQRQISGVVEWTTGTTYIRGSVVESLGEIYIRNTGAANVNNDPSGEAGWTVLPTGFANKGIWDINNTYAIGDSVKDPDNDVLSAAGSIKLAYYPPADFPSLGIPLSF